MPIDAQQLAKLIESQAAVLRLWVHSRCPSAEDVVQEAFCKLATQEPPPNNPTAWLYRVCRNLAEKQRTSDERRRKREQTRARQDETTTHLDGADALEFAEILDAVAELDDHLREVLVARIWGQLSLEKVGEMCGVSTTTAFRRYEDALRALRSKLKVECNRP